MSVFSTSAARKFVEENPNARIDKIRARKMGLPVFYDHRGCGGGHTRSWRWVKASHGRECLSCKWRLPKDRAIGFRLGRPPSIWRQIVVANPNMEMSQKDAFKLGAPLYRDKGVCSKVGHVRPWRMLAYPRHCLSCLWELPVLKRKSDIKKYNPRSHTRQWVEANLAATLSQQDAHDQGLFAYRGAVACSGCSWRYPWRHDVTNECLVCRWNIDAEEVRPASGAMDRDPET